MELVADFVGGVRRGRELRNARELAEALMVLEEDARKKQIRVENEKRRLESG